MSSAYIGQVTHYYDHLGVAVLSLTEVIRAGDWLHILGHTTDIVQPVESLEIEHSRVHQAGPDQDVAIRVAQRVRPGDQLFRITAEEARQLRAELELEQTW
jgi:hypothetical protein